MSNEATPSAVPQQGANPVQSLENRGDKEFSAVLTAQGGDQKPEHKEKTDTQASAQPAAATPAPAQAAAPAAAATPEAPKTGGIDPAVLEQVVSAAVAGARKGEPAPTAAAAAPKEISVEEFNKKYGIPTVNAEVMQRILDADPAKGAQAMQNLLLQAVRSGALIAKDALGADIGKLREEFEPHINTWKQEYNSQQEKKMYDTFFTANPDLKDERELVDAMGTEFAARVKSGQIKISSPEEGMKLVADAVRKTITRLRGAAGAAPGKGASSAAAAAPQREMSAASSAGRSGTGQPQQKSDVESVFGSDAR